VADATRTIRTRFDGDAGGLVAAAAVGEKALDSFGRSAGRSFVSRFKDSITKDERGISGVGATVAAFFGTGLVKGITASKFTVPLLAALVPILVGVVIAAGGAMAAALIAGLGAGLAGLGLFFASKFASVESAWGDAVGRMGETLKGISLPFESVLVNLATMVENTLGVFAPSLKAAFEDLAPGVERFFGFLLVALQQLEPVIQPVSDAFIAMLDALGPELPGIMQAIADNIIQIAETVERNPAAFAAFFSGALQLLNALLALVATLASAWTVLFDSFQAITQALITGFSQFGRVVVEVASIALAALRIFVDTGLFLAQKLLEGLALIPGPTQKAMRDAADAVAGFREDVSNEMGSAIQTLKDWGVALDILPKKLKLEGDISDLQQKIANGKALLLTVPPDKRVAVQADITNLQSQLFQAKVALAQLQGKTVYIDVVTRERVVISPRSTAGGTTVFGGDGAWFAAGGGTSRTEPPTVNVSPSFGPTQVFVTIDGAQLEGRVDRVVRDRESRQAWRANTGRR